MPDVVLDQVLDLGKDVVQRPGDLGHHVAAQAPRRRRTLGVQQIEDVQADGHVPREYLQNLPVVLPERRRLIRLHVEHPDHLIVEPQRNSQATGRPSHPGQVPRVAANVRTDVAPPPMGHVPADPVALRRRVDVQVLSLRQNARHQNQLQLVGPLVQQTHREVVQLQQVVHVADDLLLQQGQPLVGVQPGDLLGIQPDQFPAGVVNGVDPFLQTQGPSRVPHHRRHLRYPIVQVNHRRSRNFIEPTTRGRNTESPSSMMCRPAGASAGRPRKRLPAKPADPLPHFIWKTQHLGIGADQLTALTHDAHALRHRLQDYLRPRPRVQPPQRKKVRRAAHHQIERSAAKRFHRRIHRIHVIDQAVTRQQIRHLELRRLNPLQPQDPQCLRALDAHRHVPQHN